MNFLQAFLICAPLCFLFTALVVYIEHRRKLKHDQLMRRAGLESARMQREIIAGNKEAPPVIYRQDGTPFGFVHKDGGGVVPFLPEDTRPLLFLPNTSRYLWQQGGWYGR